MQNIEWHQQRRGTSKGMTGFPVVIQYKMVYCDYSLDVLHIKAVSYSLILLGTVPQMFMQRENAVVSSK